MQTNPGDLFGVFGNLNPTFDVPNIGLDSTGYGIQFDAGNAAFNALTNPIKAPLAALNNTVTKATTAIKPASATPSDPLAAIQQGGINNAKGAAAALNPSNWLPSADCFTFWFIRGTVIVLGFIFVAVGLSQFGVHGTIINQVTRAAKSVK